MGFHPERNGTVWRNTKCIWVGDLLGHLITAWDTTWVGISRHFVYKSKGSFRDVESTLIIICFLTFYCSLNILLAQYILILLLLRLACLCYLHLSKVIMSSLTQPELDAAASYVIQTLKEMPEFASCEVAIIGGLALWKYVPRGRTTEVGFETF